MGATDYMVSRETNGCRLLAKMHHDVSYVLISRQALYLKTVAR